MHRRTVCDVDGFDPGATADQCDRHPAPRKRSTGTTKKAANESVREINRRTTVTEDDKDSEDAQQAQDADTAAAAEPKLREPAAETKKAVDKHDDDPKADKKPSEGASSGEAA